MKHRIVIEKVNGFSSMGVAKEILLQDGIVLVAVGSSACIASLRYIAEQIGKANKLYSRDLSAREYSLGKNNSIITELIREAFKYEGLKGIIVYCSCLDIITKLDEEKIIADSSNTQNIPIAFLYRGPLAKRKMLPKDALNLIWKQWNITPNDIKINPLLTKCDVEVDFKTVILNHKTDEKILLITPGGCASCLVDISIEKKEKLYNTRFDDLFLCSCRTSDFVESIKDYFNPNDKILLLGTAITKAIGISLKEICSMLIRDGYQASFINTNGLKK